MALLFKLLIIFLLFVVPAISRMMAKAREQRELLNKAGGRPAPPAPEPLRDEIEEFLRRNARTAGSPGEAGPPRRAAVRRPPAAPAPLSLGKGARPVSTDASDAGTVGGRVGDHVKEFLDASDFKRRSSSLADDIAESNQKMNEHLKDVFGHQLGGLAKREEESSTAPEPVPLDVAAASAGLDLVALLAQPSNLRQAVLLHEILQRPEHRW
jgi:hypothetical protein